MIFRSRRRQKTNTVVADRSSTMAGVEVAEGPQKLLEEIDALTGENRARPDPEVESRIRTLRYRAGLQLTDRQAAGPEHPTPAFDLLPNGSRLPEVAPGELTAELLRAAMLRNGCLLVRGLIGTDEAARLVEEIDRAFEARDARKSGRSADDAYYEEFAPGPRFDLASHRFMVSDPNGLWVADSPRVMVDLFDTFERTGLRRLAAAYLGEHPAISVNKSTLRRLSPDAFTDDAPSAWHQDGAFLGDVRALNVWLSLSRCGDVAPGLDIVPRRIDHIVPTGTEGAVFDWSVSQAIAEEAAGDAGILRPIFEPGDVLLFDQLFLHATAAESEMSNTRHAVECWFFGPSAFPREYPPLAL